MKKVVITGMGTINANGKNINAFWQNTVTGRNGIRIVEKLGNHGLPYIPIGGEVDLSKEDLQHLDKFNRNNMDRFTHFALWAADEAIKDYGAPLPEYTPVILGVGMGGFGKLQETMDEITRRQIGNFPIRVGGFNIPAIISDSAPATIGMKYNLHGGHYSIATACASSLYALIDAADQIRFGRSDVSISGGCESIFNLAPYVGFACMDALSKNANPAQACRPWDVDRDGFILGEGAGILVLEELEHAKNRGAKIYAEIVGYAKTSDAHHLTAPDKEGTYVAKAIEFALKEAGLNPEQIQYINAHGTSTPVGDIAETLAIKKAFGKHAKKLKISSTKSMIGHLIGGAGAVETIATVLTLQNGIIHPTINLANAGPGCDLDYVPNCAKKMDVEYAVKLTSAFFGRNACMILKRYAE